MEDPSPSPRTYVNKLGRSVVLLSKYWGGRGRKISRACRPVNTVKLVSLKFSEILTQKGRWQTEEDIQH